MKWIRRLFLLTLLMAGIGSAFYFGPQMLVRAEAAVSEGASYEVRRRTLEDRVVERGTIESQNTVYGTCELPGTNKIMFIIEEGTAVKKGDKVVEFDTKEIDTSIQTKEVEVNEAEGKRDDAIQALEIKRNENETNISAAQLAYDIAVIDLKKFKEGDFIAEVADLERAIKDAERQLEEVRNDIRNIELLVKKGYRTPQQLRSYQLTENSFQFQVERDQQKLKVLVTYDREKRLTQFKGTKAETELKLARAKTTAAAEVKKGEAAIASAEKGLKLVQEQLKELQETRKKATMLAEQDGIVAYANERWYDPTDRIRAGSEIWGGRNVYFLPDMTKMQVKANVHESVVDRVKKGQPVSVRLDAFSDVKLTGVVSSVANMAASSFSSVQNYETIILIDKIPEGLSVKPGMTAEVDIQVGIYPDTLSVPIGAITEHFGLSYVYVLSESKSKAKRRVVKTGRITHAFVEITEGIEIGERVALDAYQRGKEDFADKERAAETPPPPTPTPQPGPPIGTP